MFCNDSKFMMGLKYTFLFGLETIDLNIKSNTYMNLVVILKYIETNKLDK